MKFIFVKVVGRKLLIRLNVKEDFTINDLKVKIAEQISVTPKNWGIYAKDENCLHWADERKLVTENTTYYFYPKAVIR